MCKHLIKLCKITHLNGHKQFVLGCQALLKHSASVPNFPTQHHLEFIKDIGTIKRLLLQYYCIWGYDIII